LLRRPALKSVQAAAAVLRRSSIEPRPSLSLI
jgi:hypothetical protein